jgi:hypothetical protein
MMMLLLTSTLLLANNNIDNADDADDANDINDASDVDDVNADDANNERKKRSSIEERKKSRLDINLDRVERFVICCFFASLAVNQTKFISEFALSKN